jgi:hypothetical protein
MDEAFEKVFTEWYVEQTKINEPREDLTLKVNESGDIVIDTQSRTEEEKSWHHVDVSKFIPSAVHDKISTESEYVRDYAMHIIENILRKLRVRVPVKEDGQQRTAVLSPRFYCVGKSSVPSHHAHSASKFDFRYRLKLGCSHI